MFVAVPFGKSPQLAAIVSTVLAMLFAVFALVLGRLKTGAAMVFTLAFPSSFYVFAIRAICGFENKEIPTDLLAKDPDNKLKLLPILIAAIVCFLWSIFVTSHSLDCSDQHFSMAIYRSVMGTSFIRRSGTLDSCLVLQVQDRRTPKPTA
jgi:4-amino-4-deoxy-L-arabinose transferase-like glycosyltransferase